jgi:hypothetical protein
MFTPWKEEKKGEIHKTDIMGAFSLMKIIYGGLWILLREAMAQPHWQCSPGCVIYPPEERQLDRKKEKGTEVKKYHVSPG